MFLARTPIGTPYSPAELGLSVVKTNARDAPATYTLSHNDHSGANNVYRVCPLPMGLMVASSHHLQSSQSGLRCRGESTRPLVR